MVAAVCDRRPSYASCILVMGGGYCTDGGSGGYHTHSNNSPSAWFERDIYVGIITNY